MSPNSPNVESFVNGLFSVMLFVLLFAKLAVFSLPRNNRFFFSSPEIGSGYCTVWRAFPVPGGASPGQYACKHDLIAVFVLITSW